jgi:hypothetical protein
MHKRNRATVALDVFSRKDNRGTVVIDNQLIQYFQHKNSNTINDGGKKYTLCRAIAVGIDVKCKEHRICQERQCTDGGDSLIVGDEEVEKFTEREGPVADKVNDRKTNNWTE